VSSVRVMGLKNGVACSRCGATVGCRSALRSREPLRAASANWSPAHATPSTVSEALFAAHDTSFEQG
jgi:hypothetical protein